MKYECSLPCSQELATGPYPQTEVTCPPTSRPIITFTSISSLSVNLRLKLKVRR